MLNMSGPTRPEELLSDSRTHQQAKALQKLLARLMGPEFHRRQTHPIPDIELSPREVDVMVLLDSTDGGRLTMTDVASFLGAPLSTVSRLMDRMERKGVIRRLRSEEDRRVVVVEQAEKGLELQQAFNHHKLELATRMMEPLSNGEREILLELMAKLVRGLSRSKGEAAL